MLTDHIGRETDRQKNTEGGQAAANRLTHLNSVVEVNLENLLSPYLESGMTNKSGFTT